MTNYVRLASLRLLLDQTVELADEANNRDSEERLRDAAARIHEAMTYEGYAAPPEETET